MIDALRSLQRKSRGAGEITTAIGTVRSHRQRMCDREARDAGSPIGSDPTKEAAHTMIVNTRLKSGRFDSVWAQRTQRRHHDSAHAHLWANDNRTPLARVA